MQRNAGPSTMRVRDFVITDEFQLVAATTSLKEATERLLEMRRGVLLVEDREHEVVGVVTERGLLRHLAAGERLEAPLDHIMDRHLLHLPSDLGLHEAVQQIGERQPSAVIVDASDGSFAGYFSPTDFLEAQRRMRDDI